MCSCQECPIKNSCLRFTGKASMMQSYFVDDPCEFIDDWFYCEYYIDDGVQKRRKKVEQFIKEDFAKYGDVYQALADYDNKK